MKVSETFSVRLNKEFQKPLKRYALENDILIYEIVEKAIVDFFKTVNIKMERKN